MSARIYRPAPSATQSGPGAVKPWKLDYDPETPRAIDTLMGWTSSTDMKQQIRLRFDTKEEAIAYAERNSLPYRVEEPRENLVRILPGSPILLIPLRATDCIFSKVESGLQLHHSYRDCK